MIKWIKDNWKDPVWSKVFAAIIIGIGSGIWIIIQTFIKNISIGESIQTFLKFLSHNVQIPLWLILLSCILLLYLFYKSFFSKRISFPRFSKNKTGQKNLSEFTGLEKLKYEDIKFGHDEEIDNKILKSENGIFNVWAYITDDHNKIRPMGKNMYIVGHATNNGNPLGNPSLANYPNAWAIYRISPTPKDNLGKWRFWCNDISRNITFLDYTKPLSGGWHLFTVSWSKTENYIKFIIDNKIVQEGLFNNWPSDTSGSFMLGTWPNKGNVHYFNSKVGPWKFIHSKYNDKIIEEYYNNKPEK